MRNAPRRQYYYPSTHQQGSSLQCSGDATRGNQSHATAHWLALRPIQQRDGQFTHCHAPRGATQIEPEHRPVQESAEAAQALLAGSIRAAKQCS